MSRRVDAASPDVPDADVNDQSHALLHFQQENMTARCADKSKETTSSHTPTYEITWLLVELDSFQPDVMDVGVERTFSPQNFSMFPWE